MPPSAAAVTGSRCRAPRASASSPGAARWRRADRSMDRQTLAAYDAVAPGVAEDWHDQSPPFDLHALVRRFFRPGGRTADIGCGSGREVAFLGGSGFDAVGYDASGALLQEARR